MSNIKTHKISGGGICAALCLVMLFVSSYLPAKMAFLFAASIVMGVCLLRYGGTTAFCVYGAVSLLVIFILPNKLMAWMYVALFGIYPLVKYYIERIRNIAVEYIIKFLICNIHLFFIYIILSAMGQNALYDVATFWMWLCGVFVFFLFDLLYGIFINAFYKTYYKFLK